MATQMRREEFIEQGFQRRGAGGGDADACFAAGPDRNVDGAVEEVGEVGHVGDVGDSEDCGD